MEEVALESSVFNLSKWPEALWTEGTAPIKYEQR